jgi:hypothetical protein
VFVAVKFAQRAQVFSNHTPEEFRKVSISQRQQRGTFLAKALNLGVIFGWILVAIWVAGVSMPELFKHFFQRIRQLPPVC